MATTEHERPAEPIEPADDTGPSRPPPPAEPLDPFQQRVQTAGRYAPRIALVALVVVAGLWLLSGLFIVQPGQQGVVMLFGRHAGTAGPGVNYRLPWPIQSVTVVDLQSVRRAEIGFRSAGSAAEQRVLEEALMLTRDENIVEVGLLIQYRVSDPAAFVFRVQDPEGVLRSTAEVALRGAVGRMPIDGVITERRAEVQDATRVALERLLADYGAGIQVTEVRLQVADAPDQVRDAFHEVVRAREDRERKVNEAQAYREDVVPKARGEAQQILQQALAYREERVRSARGESDRFVAVLTEYRSAPDVTRERMYIEAMERALAKVNKVLLGEGQQGVLPFLPLRDASGQARPAQTAPAPAPPAPAPAPPPAPAKPQPPAKP
jgi:membrane protease subunit HflK